MLCRCALSGFFSFKNSFPELSRASNSRVPASFLKEKGTLYIMHVRFYNKEFVYIFRFGKEIFISARTATKLNEEKKESERDTYTRKREDIAHIRHKCARAAGAKRGGV